jgi:flagellar motor switch protein FliG
MSTQFHEAAESAPTPDVDAIPPIRKAAILVVSLDESLSAQLLARLDRAAVEAVTLEMARLDRIDPEEQRAVLDEFVALGLSRLRFSFDDLARLDRDAIRDAFEPEEAETWVLALAGASRPLQARVLDTLAASDADDLRHRLGAIGPFRLSDVEHAQADLAERLRSLHDQGRITLPEPEGADGVLV